MEQTQNRAYLREYKEYHLFSVESVDQPNKCAVEIRVDQQEVDCHPAHEIEYDPADPEQLNKAIEKAKVWIDSLKRCRVCGCTALNCRKCIEKTGAPCSWVEEDLCSACVDSPVIPVVDSRASQQVDETHDSPHANVAPSFVGESTNFFTQLFNAGKSDFTLRVVNIKGKMTVGVFPSPGAKGVIPANFTMDPAELDEKFFTEIIGQLAEQMKPRLVEKSEATKPSSKPTASKRSKPNKKAPAKKKSDPKPKAKPKPKAVKKPLPNKKTERAKPQEKPAAPTLF